MKIFQILAWLTFAIFIPLSIHGQGHGHQSHQFRFIENKGQWDPSILFSSEIPGGRMTMMKDRILYYFYDIQDLARNHPGYPGSEEYTASNHLKKAESSPETRLVSLHFDNANPNPSVIGEIASVEKYNFYLGNDPSYWSADCKSFQTITYKDLYEGIDMKFYTLNGQIKYDLILKPGSNPDLIRFTYEGEMDLSLEDGRIITDTGISRWIENSPYAYQQTGSNSTKTKEVKCDYKLSDNTLTFSFPKGYKKDRELIIDPELIFSTFSGSTADNFGYTACFDDDGNLYSGGIAFGPGFPVTDEEPYNGGGYDMGILKFDSSGQQLLYATYIGGISQDTPHSLIVNNNNELIILGTTGSTNFPVSENAFQKTHRGGDVFNIFGQYNQGSDISITKLDEEGRLIASTYLGSSENDGILKLIGIRNYLNNLIQNYGDYSRGDVIIDDNDNIYIASSTEGDDFPINSSIQPGYGGGLSDAIVVKLDSDLSQVLWGTYVGGSEEDAAYSIKLGSDGHVYLAGGTNSPDFPTTSSVLHETHQGNIDGFISRFDVETDQLVHSTYLGTTAMDQIYFIDLDQDDQVFAFGQTRGNYPTTPGIYGNPGSGQFLHKMNPELSQTGFSTVIGSGSSEPDISPTAFLVNECNNIFMSGWGGIVNSGNSPNNGSTFGMPVTDDALFRQTDGSDFYMMVLSADGTQLLYGTYYGAMNPNSGDHVDGGTSRFDKRGIVYQSVCTCGGSTDNFPTTPNAWSRVNMGVDIGGNERCNNAAFKFDLATLKAQLATDNVILTERGIKDGCFPLDVVFYNESQGGEEFLWDFGDGGTSNSRDSVIHRFEQPGVYEVSLKARDINTCNVEDVAFTTITVHDTKFKISEETTICGGNTVQLVASGGAGYVWTLSDGTFIDNKSFINVNPASTTQYNLTTADANGCIYSDSVLVNVIPEVKAEFALNKIYGCEGMDQIQIINLSENAESFQWDFGDGTLSEEENPEHSYANLGTYPISLTAEKDGCYSLKEDEVLISDLFIPNVITMNNDNSNEKFEVLTENSVEMTIYNRWGKKLFKSEHYENNWPESEINAGVYYYDAAFPDGTICSGWLEIIK